VLAPNVKVRLQSILTHSDRRREWPFDAGATFGVNHFEKVPIPANGSSFRVVREMSDQAAVLMGLVILTPLGGISGMRFD
jgi:hypothetical protein